MTPKPIPERAALSAALAGLGLLTAGCLALEPPSVSLAAAVALVGGLLAWALSIAASPPRREVLPAEPAAGRSPRIPALVLATFAAACTWWLAGGGVYTRTNVATWVLAVAAWCWAWWPPVPPRRRLRRFRRNAVAAAGPTAVGLAAIVVVGAFMRLHRLGETPAQPTSDHAEKLLDISTIRAGEHPIFFPRNTGREPAQFYLTTWFGDLLGRTPDFELLKLGTALVGVAAVVAVFALARELAGSRTGLVAALLFALSHWPVGVTRTGLRHGYGPLASAVALWFAFRYLRTRDRRDALCCGLAVGIGLHGYSAFRLVPVAIAAVWFLPILVSRGAGGSFRRLAVDAGVAAGAAVAACLPLLRYTVDHPDEVFARTSSRVTGGEGTAQSAVTLSDNIWHAVLSFHWRGDDASVTVERFAPFLDALTGAALIAGLVVLVYRIAAHRDVRAVAVTVCALILLLPSALSLAFPRENPSAVRLAVVAPLIFTLAATPADRVLTLGAALDRRSGGWTARAAVAAALAAGLVGVAVVNYTRYFRDFDRQYRTFIADNRTVVEAIRRVEDAGMPLDRVYLFSRRGWVDSRNVGFELDAPSWFESHTLLPDGPVPPVTTPAAFVVHKDDNADAQAIRQAFSVASVRRWESTKPGEAFVVYVVGPP